MESQRAGHEWAVEQQQQELQCRDFPYRSPTLGQNWPGPGVPSKLSHPLGPLSSDHPHLIVTIHHWEVKPFMFQIKYSLKTYFCKTPSWVMSQGICKLPQYVLQRERGNIIKKIFFLSQRLGKMARAGEPQFRWTRTLSPKDRSSNLGIQRDSEDVGLIWVSIGFKAGRTKKPQAGSTLVLIIQWEWKPENRWGPSSL